MRQNNTKQKIKQDKTKKQDFFESTQVEFE